MTSLRTSLNWRGMLLALNRSTVWSRVTRACVVSFLFLAIVILVQVCTQGDAAPDTTKRSWDSDGDGLSDAVEMESHNRQLYGLDPYNGNGNPSSPGGFRSSGWLTNGLNLPDTGGGYINHHGSDPKDSDDWGTLDLTYVIEQVGRDFRRKPCKYLNPNADYLPRELPGDMSKQFGGDWHPDHSEHQNGLDVDVRYVRKDSTEGPLDLATVDSLNYDLQATAELMSCFLQTGRVIRMLYDSALTHIVNAPGDTTLLNASRHSDHFHVRVRNPNNGADY